MVELMEILTATAVWADDVFEDDMSEPNWAEIAAPSIIGSALRLISSQSMQHLGDDMPMRLAA